MALTGLASQIVSCLCVTFMARSLMAYPIKTPPMMFLTLILCCCSSSSTYNIGKQLMNMGNLQELLKF